MRQESGQRNSPSGGGHRPREGAAAWFGGLGAEWLAFLAMALIAATGLESPRQFLLTAIAVPVGISACRYLRRQGRLAPPQALIPARDPVTGLLDRAAALSWLQQALAVRSGRRTACFVLQLDDLGTLGAGQSGATVAAILKGCATRLAASLREGDQVTLLEGDRFAVVLAPARRVDLESAIQIAVRLQAAIEAPLPVGAARLCLTASVGFCLPERAPAPDAATLLAAAEAALQAARRTGTGAIRAFTADTRLADPHLPPLADELRDALESGRIEAWFQPQLSTETGGISGFEALARWRHPERGVLPPADFLPMVEALELQPQLTRIVLHQSLRAMRDWAEAGFEVGSVAVNFSRADLQDPQLAKRIGWELDRFELTPGQLTIEILETVVAETGDDVVVRNISALAEMGCGIDLDDFGTGHASIGHIRRFEVKRLKIDRSFITKLDREPRQQQMVAAILSMAERLELETLAEGVETQGEHAILAQLGCHHVQGFHIGRPMPFVDTLDWLTRREASILPPPAIGRGMR